MSDNDHEHRAYQVWDGASTRDIDRLESLIDQLTGRVRELEDTVREHQMAVPHADA